ncbi:hypothetical protein JCM21738_413 [Mesobacillus boroniphilus JCM 21738]|uniref:Uncharacterized protein n=1 Tax=Mesobacillus boroniphilus JCM 21738 TaxID=1294265 RepID=W4RHI6_9BACI|nr:hypothetical protein JCM21738_413 [Mesobacillus boroniphilus JCM 21738]
MKDILLKRDIITDSIKGTGYSAKKSMSFTCSSNGRKHQSQTAKGKKLLNV